MRLGKRERAAKRERLKLAGERATRISAVTGPALPTGFNRWPVGRPSLPWGFLNGKAGAPCIKPYWKAVRRIVQAGPYRPSLWKETNKLLEG